MKLLVLGSSGASGKEITSLALEKGMLVTAMVRNPAKLNLQHENLKVVQGNILDEVSISLALKNIDAVVWAIGHENKASAKKAMAMDTCSRGTANLIKAMKTQGVTHLIAITSWGVGAENRKRTPFFFKNFIFRFILNKEFEDKQKQEEIIKLSDLDYTIIRPSRLTSDETFINPEIGYRLNYNHLSHTPRKVLAQFIITELINGSFLKKVVEISCR